MFRVQRLGGRSYASVSIVDAAASPHPQPLGPVPGGMARDSKPNRWLAGVAQLLQTVACLQPSCIVSLPWSPHTREHSCAAVHAPATLTSRDAVAEPVPELGVLASRETMQLSGDVSPPVLMSTPGPAPVEMLTSAPALLMVDLPGQATDQSLLQFKELQKVPVAASNAGEPAVA